MPSEVRYRNKYVLVKADELIILLNILLNSLSLIENDNWCKQIRERWESRISGCGFGLYELDLDKSINNQDEKDRMLQIFNYAINEIKKHGEYIKKE